MLANWRFKYQQLVSRLALPTAPTENSIKHTWPCLSVCGGRYALVIPEDLQTDTTHDYVTMLKT
jgi:hypothetical protein